MARPDTLATRASFLVGIREELDEKFEQARQRVEGGPWDGVPVVTDKDLGEIMTAVFESPLPASSDHEAELATPAIITVAAICPKCHLPARIVLTIGPELRVDPAGSTVRLVGKSKPAFHVCGQLSWTNGKDGEAADGQLELEDIVRPEDALTDEDRAAGDLDLADELRCEGSNHVPGCEHLAGTAD